ncbi:MAG: mannose-1-phosphate guanylyltransferase [Cytophagaceae bacterium]|jgi:mannose-1-phosphate guanylyltransferase|nr:mannose-1-phosphate guanylyltransferase [Cytophagaceae bacterium]
MSNSNNFVVIMAGGIGSRFWPFSRTTFPKQFHDVLGIGKTMIQQTVERFATIAPKENVFIVTNSDYKELVKQQLPYLSDEQILCEPVGKNTAPCAAYACSKIYSKNFSANIIVAPADHYINDVAEFTSIVSLALQKVSTEDVLVTLGIKPNRPDTGYGYIQFMEKSGEQILKVKTFTEKPPLAMAIQFLESGDFLWNSGIFVWSAQSFLKALEKHLPDMYSLFREGKNEYWTPDEAKFIQMAYPQCKNESIDKGIMEKASNVFVIPADFGWSDVGTWKSVYELSKKDVEENAADGNILLYDTSNCIIKTPKDKLVVVEGLENYIVAEHGNVLMICKLENEQRVKEFVSDVKSQKGDKFI